MILNLMMFSVAVTALLGAAGLAFERVVSARQLPRRLVWAAAMVLSITLPLLNSLAPHQILDPTTPATTSLSRMSPASSVAAAGPADLPARIAPIHVSEPIERPAQKLQSSTRLEGTLKWLWMLTSVGLIALYVTLSLIMWASARHWQRHSVDGQEVWVTENMGPAVLGFLRPRILMPRWALEAPSSTRTVVLAHEQEHLCAGDQWLVLLGLLVTAVAPWNLPLWWQLRRLRFAIEVDCDARVLARGADPRGYGEALLSIGQRQSFTPVVAIALTEPASQLLRRIRIITSSLPKRGTWIVGAMLGATLTCAAVATQLQAPAVQSSPPALPAAAQLPLKLPPGGHDPWADRAMAAARTLYPELLRSPASNGNVFVTLALNADGTVFKSAKEFVGPENWSYNATTQAAYDRVGVYWEQVQADGVIFQDKSAESANAFGVTYVALKPEPELTRLRLLRKAVTEHFADSFLTLTENGPRVNTLTVFLTESGDIDKARISPAPDKSTRESLLTTARFAALGVDPSRVGSIGKMMMLESPVAKGGSDRGLFVVYSWPRSPGESGPTIVPEDNSTPPGDDPAVDLAIVEHFLPDAFTTPESISTPLPWVLLDRAGHVLRTGRFQFTGSNVLTSYLEAVYPGIKIQGYSGGPVVNAMGEHASVSFLWLAPDSRITDLLKIDAAQRKDVFLTVSLSTNDSPYPLELPLALRFGVPAIADGGGSVQLQAIATNSGANYVDVDIRPRPHDAGTALTPNANSTPWPTRGPKVRIAYGTEATTIFQDDKKRTWKIVIRPERLTPRNT